MALLLVLIPVFAGLAAFALGEDKARRVLLVGAAVVHAAAVATTWVVPTDPLFGGWLMLDAPGRLFLSIASAVFLAAAVYAVGYLPHARQSIDEESDLFVPEPEAVFTGCLLLFLASMSLVCTSGHFGLLWVAVEASTLASAPLIYYHRSARSLEAMWKYLVMCSVGVALALLGNFLLATAARAQGPQATVFLSDLTAAGTRLHIPWMKAAFLFFLVGYGTKMGLAPLHNWLPDAHSESPSPVSALLSGALLNCAFLAILRALQVCETAGIGAFARPLLVVFGLLSMAMAAVFILRQADFKRMLAYSSVEHMGVIALGVGLGGAAASGAMLHAVGHSLTKAMLFLVAGNVIAAYHTKAATHVDGAIRALPVSGVLWIGGFFAITGSPPFSPFLSEFAIFRAAIGDGCVYTGVAYLVLLALVFIGMAGVMLRMSQGSPTRGDIVAAGEPWLATAPPLALMACVLVLGVYIPGPLQDTLHEAARAVGGY